mgnify:CR=1 FL=1
MFYSIKEEIIDNDYLFFFNANALFVTHIEADILPDEEHNNLVGAIHPGYRGMKPENIRMKEINVLLHIYLTTKENIISRMFLEESKMSLLN